VKKHPFLAFVAILLTTALACVQPGASAPAPDPNAGNTSIAQTIAARQTEAALNNPATATFTFTPEIPTLTLEPTLSATPDFTATPTTPMISVSEDTNCRVGPGKAYERVGILLVGETAEIVGREPKGEYWLIRNPDTGVDLCWVWNEYATITGNIYTLLLYTPPPVAASSFTVSFKGLGTCSIWWADFQLSNTSDALFKSITIVFKDADTVTEARLDSNGFIENQGCGAPKTTSSLVAGGNLIVSSPSFAYNPTKHNLNAKITVCTELNQKGTCVVRELTFKP